MKTYNIAQFGTFDLENFGDLLFPNVLEKNLKQRFDNCNLVLFSPVGGKKPFEEDVTVYPISKFSELNEKYNFDAIILGGGDLLRLDETVAKKDRYSANKAAFDLFIMPSVFADKHNIPLYYNVPGAPYEFSEVQRDLISAIANTVSYFSVRDTRTKQFFTDCLKESCPEITISPDSILDIASVYPKETLSERFSKFSSDYSIAENKYIVFQTISTITTENEYIFAKEFDTLAEKTGCDIVFMPINYVHNDTDIMKSIFDKMTTPNRKFVDEHLSPFEMISLLAHSVGYVGSSLHGGIVSMAYGKKALAINLLGLSKLTGIFDNLGLKDNIILDATKICDDFLSAKVLTENELNGFINKISAHFDALCDCIKERKQQKFCLAENIIEQYHDLIAGLAIASRTPACTIYFDKDGEFSEGYKISGNATKTSDKGYSFEFDIPEGTTKLRFDPDEGFASIISNPYIEYGFEKYAITAINGADFGKFVVFDTTDPQFIINLYGSAKKMRISFEYLPLCEGDYKYVLTDISNKYKTEKEEFNDKIAEIKEKYTEANKTLALENKKLTQSVSEQAHRIEALNDSIHQIQTSFCWRITSPIRTISRIRIKFIKGLYYLKNNGIKATIRRIRGPKPSKNYLAGLTADNQISQSERKKQEAVKFDKDIKFSVIVPLYNTPEKFLREMIDSVTAQTYSNWELCLADGSDDSHKNVASICKQYIKSDKRIVYKKLEKNLGISENTNACLDMATGNYIALFDHDDILHPSALYEFAKTICETDADFIYSDEDKFKKLGQGFYDAHFKPDFAIDNLRANNYICHFTVFAKSLFDQVGGFRKEFDGSQDHDLILRLTEKAKHIVHIPKLLYHWRISDASVASDPYAKPYTISAGINAVSEHLERCGLKGTVESTKIHPNIYRIKYDIIGEPLVSILIPNYNHVDELSTCINSIIEKSTYKNYEIIIIENNSNEETFAYYETLKEYPQVKVVVYETNEEFNYSAINNYGAKFANGEHIILLNNDIEVITPEWIEEMLMFSQREDVGAVGAMLYYPDDTIQHAGVILGLLSLAGHAFKNTPRDNPGYFGRAGFQQNLTACTAACLMIPRKVFDEVEGLDEKFAVAFNDIDLCMKIRDKGHLIVFTPFAELYHYESKSRGLEDTPKKVKRFQGEIQRFYDKWQDELDKGDPYYNPNLTLDREDFSLR